MRGMGRGSTSFKGAGGIRERRGGGQSGRHTVRRELGEREWGPGASVAARGEEMRPATAPGRQAQVAPWLPNRGGRRGIGDAARRD
jgi:hypothetical protein